MTHRIYKAICTVAVVVFLCSLALNRPWGGAQREFIL